MNEKTFTIHFKHWIELNPPEISTAYELKVSHKTYFSIKRWVAMQPHQYANLIKAKHEFMYHKISDQSSGQKPFDCFAIANGAAYLVIYYSKVNVFYMYPIDYIRNLLKTSKSVEFATSPVIYRHEMPTKQFNITNFKI